MAKSKKTSRGGSKRGKVKKGVTRQGRKHHQRGKTAHMRKTT
jgi:hypothetical protein